MKAIEVNKADLEQALRVNRDEHVTIYQKALEAYKVKVRAWLEDNLAYIEAGEFDKVRRTCPYPTPEEHTEDFQRVIDMLGWDIHTTYELNERDFQCYVQNEWDWNRSFMANTAAYLVTEGDQ